MSYYFDDDAPLDHWKRLDEVTSNKEAIEAGEKLRKPQYNSIVYKDGKSCNTLVAVKEWTREEVPPRVS